MSGASPFDALAATYDGTFTDTPLGRTLRRRVWHHLDSLFSPGMKVLEVGCGTGEDAIHLGARGVAVAATDASREMAAVALRKVALARLDDHVTVTAVPAGELRKQLRALGAPFDGAFSSFGALNCVEDLPELGRTLAAALRPGAPALLVVMGPVVPWEWAWQLLHLAPLAAFRRLRPGGTPWRGVTVRYPAPRELDAALRPAFRRTGLSALGALLPPTEAEGWAREHPDLLRALDTAERALEECAPLAHLADHYVARYDRA